MLRQRLVEIMEEKNLNQTRVHDLTGLSKGVINNILKGRVKSLNSKNLERLAQGLGVQEQEFISGKSSIDARWIALGKQFEEAGISPEWVSEFLGLVRRLLGAQKVDK